VSQGESWPPCRRRKSEQTISFRGEFLDAIKEENYGIIGSYDADDCNYIKYLEKELALARRLTPTPQITDEEVREWCDNYCYSEGISNIYRVTIIGLLKSFAKYQRERSAR